MGRLSRRRRRHDAWAWRICDSFPPARAGQIRPQPVNGRHTAAWCGRLAQLVEQLTLNQRVVGSSPTAPTNHSKTLQPKNVNRMGARSAPCASAIASVRMLLLSPRYPRRQLGPAPQPLSPQRRHAGRCGRSTAARCPHATAATRARRWHPAAPAPRGYAPPSAPPGRPAAPRCGQRAGRLTGPGARMGAAAYAAKQKEAGGFRPAYEGGPERSNGRARCHHAGRRRNTSWR
jgi:hypothetical protein